MKSLAEAQGHEEKSELKPHVIGSMMTAISCPERLTAARGSRRTGHDNILEGFASWSLWERFSVADCFPHGRQGVEQAQSRSSKALNRP